MTEHEERMSRADIKAEPAFYFSYVLEYPDGSFYVGHTNAPLARWTEHAVGIGADATASRGAFTVRVAMPFFSRREAQYNEERLQDALRKGRLEDLVSVYHQMLSVVRPEKTFRELQEEQADRDRVAAKSYHLLVRKTGDMYMSASCGYQGSGYGSVWEMDARLMSPNNSFEANDIGSMNASMLVQRERERQALEGVGGTYGKRPVCIPCYKIAQVAE